MPIKGMQLKNARIQMQKTQADISLITGLSIRTIADIENMNDLVKSPSLRNVEKMAVAVGMTLGLMKHTVPTLDDLLYGDQKNEGYEESTKQRYRPRG